MYPPSQQQWKRDFLTSSYTHITTGVQVTEEMVIEHGLPPRDLQTELEIRTWYFNEMTKVRTKTAMSQIMQQQARLHAQYLQRQQIAFRHLYQTGTVSCPSPYHDPTEPIELLLCVESFIVRIPKYQISVASLEWLHCRTSKDSVWLSCSLVKSPQPIKLWEKDFIVIQITPPGLDPINEVACGCKLKIVGPIVLGEAPQVRLEDLAIRDVPFFSISEMR